ncbi:MAG: hypothetical protein ABIN36_17180 [Ferruginibacter sp.]
MKTTRPFTFILHIVSNNEHITDMTISGFALRSTTPDSEVEHLSYSINQITLDRSDLINISAHIDMQQINSACFNYAQKLFADDIKLENELRNTPAKSAPFLEAVSN